MNFLICSLSNLLNFESNLLRCLNKEVQYFFVGFLERLERSVNQGAAMKHSWRPLPNPKFPPTCLFHFLTLKYLLNGDLLRD